MANSMGEIPRGYYDVLLTGEEIREIIKALEKVAGEETELGNDLKMVLAGVL